MTDKTRMAYKTAFDTTGPLLLGFGAHYLIDKQYWGIVCIGAGLIIILTRHYINDKYTNRQVD